MNENQGESQQPDERSPVEREENCFVEQRPQRAEEEELGQPAEIRAVSSQESSDQTRHGQAACDPEGLAECLAKDLSERHPRSSGGDSDNVGVGDSDSVGWGFA